MSSISNGWARTRATIAETVARSLKHGMTTEIFMNSPLAAPSAARPSGEGSFAGRRRRELVGRLPEHRPCRRSLKWRVGRFAGRGAGAQAHLLNKGETRAQIERRN